MRKGDIVVNPWVARDFNGELNPMYATIYIGNNCTIDYTGQRHTWCDKLTRPDTWEREWRVIGHVDIDLRKLILSAVIADETERRTTDD